ncbi:MAG: efflux transporter outer membrane subunit [Chitinophagaceae bacterium]|nr:efflux transporter outer membrane subunit [Chitinophagaceae bacterium]
MKQFLLFFIFLNLFSCSLVGPDYKRPEINLPNTYHQEVDRENVVTDLNNWWKLYQDPVLNELMDKALIKNTDINAAIARLEESDAYLKEVGAALLPEVDLTSQTSRTKSTTTGAIANPKPIRKDYLIRLGTSFELDFWGKLRRAKESARAEYLASQFSKDTVVLTLQSLLASNYLLLRSIDSQIVALKANVKCRGENLTLTKKRLESGLVSALDVHQAEAAFNNLSAQLSDLIRQREIIFNQLTVLSGDMNLVIPDVTMDALITPPTPPSGLPSSLLESRPDVREAEQMMIAANANIGVAKAALFPTISLTANFGAQSAALSNLNKSGSDIWGGGLGLSLPIFDAGRVRSKIDQATAKQKEALSYYESSIQNAFKEVNNALVSLKEYTEQENDLKLTQEAAKKAMDIASNRYKAGYSSYLEYLDAQRVFNDASIAYIQKRQLRLMASVELFKSLGGGWQSQAQ